MANQEILWGCCTSDPRRSRYQPLQNSPFKIQNSSFLIHNSSFLLTRIVPQQWVQKQGLWVEQVRILHQRCGVQPHIDHRDGPVQRAGGWSWATNCRDVLSWPAHGISRIQRRGHSAGSGGEVEARAAVRPGVLCPKPFLFCVRTRKEPVRQIIPRNRGVQGNACALTPAAGAIYMYPGVPADHVAVRLLYAELLASQQRRGAVLVPRVVSVSRERTVFHQREDHRRWGLRQRFWQAPDRASRPGFHVRLDVAGAEVRRSSVRAPEVREQDHADDGEGGGCRVGAVLATAASAQPATPRDDCRPVAGGRSSLQFGVRGRGRDEAQLWHLRGALGPSAARPPWA